MVGPSDLAVATAVHKLERAPGWYVADLPPAWSYTTPSGGVLMTLALRAMAAELAGSGMAALSATTLFMSPLPAGPMEIRVEVLRKGSAAAQLRAALSSTEKPGPGLEVSATFGRERAGPDVYGLSMPEVPGPEQATEAGDRVAGRKPPFIRNFDIRLALGPALWEPGWEAGEARMALWYRYRVPQRLPHGGFDPLALPPIADTMPWALMRRLGPEHPRFHAPSLDLTVHFLDPSRSEWHLVDVRCQRARAGAASAHAIIWDADGKLVASAAQMMMLRRRPNDPTR